MLPVYDKPLIHCPLETLLKAGIREIAVVTGNEHLDQIAAYLGSGSKFDCTFAFKVQEHPGGIAQALGLAEEFAAGESVCAILGDNVFFDDLTTVIKGFKSGAHVFLKHVDDPKRFGVAEVADHSPLNATRLVNVCSIEEKPRQPKSNYAITGCYLYDNRCFECIRTMSPSARGELEITDVSRWFLERNELQATILEHEWIDAGTFESLFEAATLVRNRRKK